MNNPVITPFTMSALIGVNNSPLSGIEGKKLTSSMIRERLNDEAHSDQSIRVNDTDSSEIFEILLCDESQLISLVENMRREGFELTVSTLQVLFERDKNDSTILLEPYVKLVIDAPTDCIHNVYYELSHRRGTVADLSDFDGTTRVIYHAPLRFLSGFRQKFVNITRGFGVLEKSFLKYDKVVAATCERSRKGCLISSETGEAVGYALSKLQDRGVMYIKPNDKVYTGMIVGENSSNEDMEINVVKGKSLSNMRASGSEEAFNLAPPRIMGFDEMIEYINQDECIEVTPISFRIRKKILDSLARKSRVSRFQSPL